MGKKIKIFEYDDAWIHCVLNDIKNFQVVKQGKRKYSILIKSKNKNKWVYE
jgi:hypothetical protein